MTACILLAWLKLLALDGDLAKAEPKTLRYRLLHAAARLVRGGRRRTLKIAATGPGPTRSSPPGSGSRRYRAQSDQLKARPSEKERNPRGPWNPGHPARQPGRRRHTPGLKSGTGNPPDDRQRQPSAPVKNQG